MFLASAQGAHAEDLVLSDIGSPSAPSTVVTDVSGTTITTTARGLAAVSSQDEIAFYQQELRSTGTLEWTQGTLGSGQAGRCDGLMIRRSLDADSAMVFFGYQNDGTGTPKVVLTWRSTDGGSLVSKIINDTPLRDGMGVLRLSLEWIRGKVVAKYFADSTDTWTPLYALDLEADSSGKVLGGFARASGTSAASWGALLASDAEAVEAGHASAWSKVSEPRLGGIAERATTLGVSSISAVPSPSATAPAHHWTVVSATGFAGGDHFTCPVGTTEAASVYLNTLSSPATANEAVDVFVRWGSPSSGTAALDVDVSILEASTEVASRVLDQDVDVGLWVYAGTAPATTGQHDLTVKLDVPTQAAATFSIDGVLLLSRGNDADSDGDGLPDAWESAFTYAGYTPAHDDDGDGISNLEEYEQGLDPWGGPSLYGFDYPVVTPVLISTDPSEATLERRAPWGYVRRKPLQYKVTYPGTSTPIHGFRFIFTAGSGVNKVAFGRSFDGSFATGDMTAHTDAQGLATAYIKLVEEAEDLLISGQILVASGDEFIVDSYENHPPGPVDATASQYTLTKVRDIAYGGQMAASGPWLAACNNGAGPTLYGLVQLFQWESLTNSWRATHTVTAPTGASGTSGFGDLIALSGSTLAVYASGLEKVFIFELQSGTQFWEHTATFNTPSAIPVNSMALTGTRLVLGVVGEGRAYSFSKAGSSPWAADSPAYVEVAVGDAADLDFARAVGFSSDGATMLVGAPQSAAAASTVHGKVNLYTRSGSGWSLAQTLTTPSGGETGQFGFSGTLAADSLYIGTPARAGVSPSVMGKVWISQKVSGTWQAPTSLDGPSDDFGTKVWADAARFLVGYRAQGTASSGGFVFDAVSVYEPSGSGPVLRQTLSKQGDFAAFDDGSLFVVHPATAGGAAEYKFVPAVAYNAAANTLVATLDYNDIDADIDRVQLSQPWDLWALGGTSLDELKVAVSANLLPHAGTLQWVGLELEDLAAMKYNEILAVKITGQTPAAPDDLAATVTSSGLPFLTWEHELSSQVSIQVERANLPANTSPTGSESYALVRVVEGTASHTYDSSATIFQDYAYRVRAENVEGVSGYSNVVVVHWDADSDSLPDWWEEEHGGNLVASNDDDGDGLTNLAEYTGKTNPTLTDSDYDGSPDGLDSYPVDHMNNPLSLRVFTKLMNY